MRRGQKRQKERPTTPRDNTPILVNGREVDTDSIPDIIPATPTVSLTNSPVTSFSNINYPDYDSIMDDDVSVHFNQNPPRSQTPELSEITVKGSSPKRSPQAIPSETNISEQSILSHENTLSTVDQWVTTEDIGQSVIDLPNQSVQQEETRQDDDEDEQYETIEESEDEELSNRNTARRISPYHNQRRNALINLGFSGDDVPIPDSPRSMDSDIAGVNLESMNSVDSDEGIIATIRQVRNTQPVRNSQTFVAKEPSPRSRPTSVETATSPIRTGSPRNSLVSTENIHYSPNIRPVSPNIRSIVSNITTEVSPPPNVQVATSPVQRARSPRASVTVEQTMPQSEQQPYERMRTYSGYDALPKHEQIRHREMFKHKFAIVKEMNPTFSIPDLDRTPLDELHISYDECLRQIQFKKNVGHHKLFLIAGLIVVELLMVKGLGLNMGGFTINQISGLNRYDSILLQLGEYEIVSVPDDWPVWAQLSFMVLIQAIIFWFVKWISSKYGNDVGNMVQGIADNIHGVVQKGGDILGNIGGNGFNLNTLLNVAGAFMNNNNNNQKPPTQPAYRD